ncbi:MAG: hypothetical protein JRE24_09725 [Deltaproteobacteria bacterium]|jgi:hypothetical protein|nr:hypothetical protein [Deltaproteobacteria bacterium]
MEHAHIEQIEANMPGLKLLEHCMLEHCNCYKPGFGFTCEAQDVGLDSYIECLEKDSYKCPFSMSYADSHYCTSPARVYIAKEIEK